MRLTKLINLLIITGLLSYTACSKKQEVITLEYLLDEMVSVKNVTHFPDPSFTTHQVSSFDRKSVSPDDPSWFANNDGYGVVRVDTVDGRIEKVMFDEKGPGVITRIWITTKDKRGTWRFYFDDAENPGLIIPSYDLMEIPVAGLGRGLLHPHTSYTSDGKGGNTLFLPFPFARSCKITFEDEPGIKPTAKYYGINYRRYPENTLIEAFSSKVAKRAKNKIAEADHLLQNPTHTESGKEITSGGVVLPADSLTIELPTGGNIIDEVKFNVNLKDTALFGQLMRELIFVASFDNKQTVWVPLGDFSGGGMGAPYVKSWYLESDGKGNITSRWLMPYREIGELKLINTSIFPVNVKIEAKVSPFSWRENSLYFHASWRQETGIPLFKHNEPEKAIEWNFATIEGKGVYVGDALSLFNHAPRWYGEGDEKIWVDNDTFPSHFGTGTEDYYNSSWAPVVPFYTPFGGAPRADLESSHGYNAWLRTRNLDAIPFKEKFRFNLEVIGWDRGSVDYATTIYWYGEFNSRALGLSGIEEAKKTLHPVPENPADYKIADAIEFETLDISDKTPSLRVLQQSAAGFSNGRWSRASHLLVKDGKEGDFLEFSFDHLSSDRYQMILYATQAKDYGKIIFRVNDQPVNIQFDGYSKEIRHSKPLNLGTFSPQSGSIKLRVQITGTNKLSEGGKYIVGLDCIQLLPI